MVDEQVQLGWKVPLEVRDAFTKFANMVGNVIQEDCAGALTIWPYLPSEVRERAKLVAKGLVEDDPEFWEVFQSGVQLGLRARTNTPPKKPASKK